MNLDNNIKPAKLIDPSSFLSIDSKISLNSSSCAAIPKLLTTFFSSAEEIYPLRSASKASNDAFNSSI
jgi:hypothetical protein